MNKTAIILGASGLTGSILLELLLQDDRYSLVKVFSRKSIENKHVKIKEFIGDLLQLESFANDFTGDDCFCCIGTTAKKTPGKDLYRKIDFGIPVAAAKLCAQNKIPTFAVISALGADAKSSIFYTRTKGEMEEAVLQEKIQDTYLFEPSLIFGDRKESRIGEKIAIVLTKIFGFLLVGKLEKYKGIEAENIAKAMLYVANNKTDATRIPSDKIQRIAKLSS